MSCFLFPLFFSSTLFVCLSVCSFGFSVCPHLSLTIAVLWTVCPCLWFGSKSGQSQPGSATLGELIFICSHIQIRYIDIFFYSVFNIISSQDDKGMNAKIRRLSDHEALFDEVLKKANMYRLASWMLLLFTM